MDPIDLLEQYARTIVPTPMVRIWPVAEPFEQLAEEPRR